MGASFAAFCALVDEAMAQDQGCFCEAKDMITGTHGGIGWVPASQRCTVRWETLNSAAALVVVRSILVSHSRSAAGVILDS